VDPLLTPPYGVPKSISRDQRSIKLQVGPGAKNEKCPMRTDKSDDQKKAFYDSRGIAIQEKYG
jgi:hypothetical protein